jgi:cytochrome c
VKIANLFSLCAASTIIMAASGVLAAGDIVKGSNVAKKCKACHTMNKGGKNRLGPNLFDILDKPAGAVKGYRYSRAMSSSGIVWDGATFTAFVRKPKKIVKGTKMSFAGIKRATQRADLLAYFETLRSTTGNQASAGDVEGGKRVAAKHCVVCHSFEKGGKQVYGPSLFGIAGKTAGAIKGYNYSVALKASGLIWTDKNLIGFFANPEQFVKGTKARFPGLKSAKQKADILAYIKTLK